MAWQRPSYLPDNYTLLLVGMVVLASFLPAAGIWARGLEGLTTVAIAALFFLHGAKLSREAIIAGFGHWRLHGSILSCTFIVFPILGILLGPVLRPLLGDELYAGVLYLCVLPSTVQSAIALTSMGRGNVPAAVCAASGSTLLGVFITPLLVGWLITSTAGQMDVLDSVGRILLQLMLPFAIGHLLRPWLQSFMQRSRGLVMMVDRGSVLLVVYTAFSAAVLKGLWQQVDLSTIIILVVLSCIIFTISLCFAGWLGRRMGFTRADRVTMMLASSQKSLASGVPMAQVLFSVSAIGMMVLPVMIYHQLQLMICSILAQRWGKAADREAAQEMTQRESKTP